MTEKETLRAIFAAALEAVKPDEALLKHVKRCGNILTAGSRTYNLEGRRIIVAGAGKGAAPLAVALESLLGDAIEKGHIVVKYGHALELRRLSLAESSHPLPDRAGEEGARRLLALASEAGRGDLLICLFTGGASALLPAPAPGLSLAALQRTTSLLLGAGASIDEVNAVRKHLSRLSGGRLARAAAGADILTILVSDVIGDDPGVIASGPTAPDKTTFQDCLGIIDRYGLHAALPSVVLDFLRAGAAGALPETPKPGNALFAHVENLIIADNGQALDAAAEAARNLGFAVERVQEPVRGEARCAAAALAARAREIGARLRPGEKPVCLLAGGETTVSLAGRGRGGRNQEMALAAAIELENCPNIAALFAGTDGTDGPTDAAGGFAFGDTARKMGGAARAREYLAANDSHAAFTAAGELFVTGPTRTNVMDIAILLVTPDLRAQTDALKQTQFALREPRIGDYGWIVSHQARLYAAEFGWNVEYEALVAEIVAAFIRGFKPGRERCWIAERDGVPVGYVFLVEKDAQTAQLRLLSVDPAARGAGLGTRLVEECVRFARAAGYERIVLWTNNVLRSARGIYERAGFRLVDEQPHHSFGKDLVGQTLELSLRP